MTWRPAPDARSIAEDDRLSVRPRDLPIARTGETHPWTTIDLAAHDGSPSCVSAPDTKAPHL